MKTKLILGIISLMFSSIYAQTKEDVSKMVSEYDLDKIRTKEIEFKAKHEARKSKAVALAKINGWPLSKLNEDGSYQELMYVTSDGYPIYYSTDNVVAARSTRTNYLNTGGGLGLTLDGQGMVPRVWDGGTVRRTHSGFGGRVNTIDDPTGTTYGSHPTHVTGTILALPWNTTTALPTKGMATAATARTFSFDGDESEAISELPQGMILSNHSYGVPLISPTNGAVAPAWLVGAYTEDARAWDEITNLSTYYLPVFSAGNNGTDNNTNPIQAGYDKLIGNKVSKNVLTVASANDATINADGSLGSVTISSFSSQGPTDDRRIKPDIAGNGAGLTSTNSTSNTATTSMSGTSMSAPNVTGTLTLLQQHYRNIHGHFMRSAMLKGLACHTADDTGRPGPDVNFGWGLLNAKKAAETITGDGLTSILSEITLNQGQTYTTTVRAVGGATPLIASATWTDLPGAINDGTHGDNYNVPALVNDLDIRITRLSTTYFPWKLDALPSSNAIRTGDNNIDNVEAVKIDAPTADDYVVTITHKGNLVGGNQKFALVITGITSNIALESTSDDLTVCSNQNAVFTFNYKQTGGGTSTFSAINLPSGATASFSPTSLSANGTVTMTVSNLNAVPYGNYSIGISANNGSETETRFKSLKVFSTTVVAVNQIAPTNNYPDLPTSYIFKWAEDDNSEDYNLQISTSNTFATTFLNVTGIKSGAYAVSGLAEETTYYWRVIPSNRCATGPSSATRSFVTGKYICGANTYTATDFSNATIATTQDVTASVPIVVADNFKIGDLNVTVDITHTWIGDMIITLKGPAAIGSPEIILFDQPCAGSNSTYPNIQAILDDSGVNHSCSATAPVVSGTVKPNQSLYDLNGLNAQGTWTLHVLDVGPGDGGSINTFALNFCKVEQSLGLNDSVFNNMTVYPNPTKGLLNINLNAMVTGETIYSIYDFQGRLIASKKSSESIETLNIGNFADGLYVLTLENGKHKTVKKIVLNK
ncbi:T9SS type A sorting domain-containing protein [Flavobacterium amnicola]|uniref:T9SS type A sorting domain-containing protein n=1 Tax=Flavobacterium amnicola TaxID=2506422 RepID=A0A4Q1K685_9FLAO|nr:S8 family serine peptidase [Flavobacterium amnicola]RXR21040.1 T9SS type A sorting domain-containing protein [Flavobacterium amnicola]